MGIMNWIKREEKAEVQEVKVTTNMTRYYMEAYLTSLPVCHRYDVFEECGGQMLTHLNDVTLQEARDYCRMVYIDSSPPKFVLKVTVG
tara:strand:- start:154 stop:417 length:264 start_codon:yes stop_codon:yes gene_type:complete